MTSRPTMDLDALGTAIGRADNPVAAAKALGQLAASHGRPEYAGQVAAFENAARVALAPFWADRAKGMAEAICAAAWSLQPRTNGRPPTARLDEAEIVILADVAPQRTLWLWPGRIPLGKQGILDGNPGLGKSSVTIDLAARLSIGAAMPDGALPDFEGPAGTVLLAAEDGLADTVRPRFDAACGDPARIAVLRFVRSQDGPRAPTVRDVAAIGEAIERVGARLLVIDPLVAYLGADVNSHRDQDVRAVLADLTDLADRARVSVLGVRHLNKSSGGNPLYRGGGSIGLIAAARAGLLVAPDPQDETGSRRVLVPTKSNLSAPAKALSYRLDAADGVVRVIWTGETNHRAAELLEDQDAEARSARNEAAEFLFSELRSRPVATKDLQARARDAGLAWRTVRRAADSLRVEKKKTDFAGGWVWELPEVGRYGSPKVSISESLDTFGRQDGPEATSGAASPEGGQGSETLATFEDGQLASEGGHEGGQSKRGMDTFDNTTTTQGDSGGEPAEDVQVGEKGHLREDLDADLDRALGGAA